MSVGIFLHVSELNMDNNKLENTHQNILSVSILDAAKMTGLSRSSIYELLNDGRLRSVLIGKRRLIPTSALRELIGESV